MKILVKYFDVHLSSQEAVGLNNNPPVDIECEPLNETVLDLKNRLNSGKNLQVCFEGRILSDSTPLSDLKLSDSHVATFHAIVGSKFMSPESNKGNKAKISEGDVMRLYHGLRSCLSERTKRKRLHITLLNKDNTRQLVEKFPALADDLEAMALLKYPVLLYRMIAVPDECHKLLLKHPVLADVLAHVTQQVINGDSELEQNPTAEMFSDPVVALVTGLGLLDEEDDGSVQQMEGVMRNTRRPGAQPRQQAARRSNPPQQAANQNAISSQMLSNALSAVLLGLAQQQQGGSSQSSTSSGQQPPVQPPSSNSQPPPSPQPTGAASQPPVDNRRRFETELAVLRSMGIENEAIALAALEATNGNIEAAVEFVFSSME